MRRKNLKRKTLFTSITLRLTFPLLFLTLVFAAIQLTSQMGTMNQYYKIESRLAFDGMQKTLNELLKDQNQLSDLGGLKTRLDTLENNYRTGPIQIIDMFSRAPLIKDDQNEWTAADFQAVEKSLRLKELGKLYYIQIDKIAGKLEAYIPLESNAKDHLWVARTTFTLAHLEDALINSRWTLGIMCFLILLTGIFIGHGLAKSIVNPIRTLNEATQEIMEGHLGKHVIISTGDEIETLADTFNHMSESLKIMKEQAEDANPLTGLPGNQGIFHEVSKRIYEKQKFVLFHTDLDRFKVFNDIYGIARGDEVIKKTANLLKQVIKEKGAKDDFVGHQGGDDFVLIVRPAHAKELAEAVIQRFDQEVVKSVYRKEDYERGYVTTYDRRSMAEAGEKEAKMVQFPLVGLSLAGVSNSKRDFGDYFDCLTRAVGVKKEVKKAIESSFLIEE